jgi:hypothetical protein
MVKDINSESRVPTRADAFRHAQERTYSTFKYVCGRARAHTHSGLPEERVPSRATFTLVLQSLPSDVPEFIRLRRALKFLLRSCGLRCTGIECNGPANASEGSKPTITADEASTRETGRKSSGQVVRCFTCAPLNHRRGKQAARGLEGKRGSFPQRNAPCGPLTELPANEIKAHP